MSEPSPPAPADAPPAPVPKAPRASAALLRHGWRVLLTAVLGLPLAAALALVVVLHSESGTAWLLSGVPGVQVQAPRGALLGPEFAAQRLRVRLPGQRGELDIRDLQWRGAQWRWWLREKVWVGLRVDHVVASEVRYRSGPTPSTPRTPPADLRWPLELHIARLSVATLAIDDLPAATDVSASVHLGEEHGQRHRLEALALRWDRIETRGSIAVQADGRMALDARLDLRHAHVSPEWTALVTATGPLATVQVTGALRATRGGIASSGLDLQATLQPFAAWPLGDVELRMRTQDLALLSSRLPQTRLSGNARVLSSGPQRPIDVELSVDNATPGTWDQGRLPVRQARVAVRGASGTPVVEIARLDLDLGPAAAASGQWRSSGRWDTEGLRLQGQLQTLSLRALDTAWPALTIGGPLTLRLAGLPAPPGAPQGPARGPLSVALDGALEGRLEGLGQAVSLALDASATAGRIEVRRLRARSGEASAEASLRVEGGIAGPWNVKSEGQVLDIDPQPWLSVDAPAPWRRGPHRLNAKWHAELAVPANASAMTALQWLQSLRGTGQLQIGDSLVAGVKVRGAIALGQFASAVPSERSTLEADITVGRNRLQLRGRGDVAGTGEADRWSLDIDAPRLEDLGPLTRLMPTLATWAPEAGQARARVDTVGRWPQMRTEGSGEITGLRAGPVTARSGQARWAVDTGLSRPLQVDGELVEAAWGQNRLALLRGQVSGSWGRHQATLEVAAPLTPPPWTQKWLALSPGVGTQATLALEGGWQALGATAGRWTGTVKHVAIGAWPGSGPRRAATEAAPWLESSQLRGELDVSHDGRLLRAQALPGAARLAGGLQLRWDAARWASAEPAQFELRSRIEPFALVPWLKRADSGVNWGGDLRVAADVALRAGDSFQAEAVLRRVDGDLTVGDAQLTQSLGLSEAELRVRAADGRWTFVPTLQGKTLGIVSGTVGLRTAPQAMWPDTDAVLDGAVRVAVPDLNVWTGWLPPGWRVDGTLESTARLSGRFGAPALTGALQAQRVAVRNLLQGVAFTDGDVRVALEGDTARVERFILRTGEGMLTVEGDASLGAQPQARLTLKAQALRLLGRIDRQLVASGQARLLLQPDRLNLQGRIAVDSGLFDLSSRDAPSLDDDVSIRTAANTPQAMKAVTPEPPALMRASSVALDLDFGEQLRIQGRGLTSSLRGTVRVSTAAGRLAVHGSVRAVGGSYAAYGQRLQIERGVLEFAGRPDQPRLDILALRPNTDLRVGVAITGTADAPRVRLYSDPEMGETDKLSWLVLGRGSEGLVRADTAVLQRAAIALLAGEGEAPTDALIRNLGIDELSLRQADGEMRDTVISLGKQLSRNWYVGYERSVNATNGTWQLIYRLAQRFTLRAQSGSENSLDLIWTWRFDQVRPAANAKAPP